MHRRIIKNRIIRTYLPEARAAKTGITARQEVLMDKRIP